MSNGVERKDPFAHLPSNIEQFCSLHNMKTPHIRMVGTDTYLCNLSHEGLIKSRGGIVFDVPTADPMDPGESDFQRGT